ncbi:nucleoid-associated protein [Ectothiorhodospira shaposhnikovii]|uniref:nucleoid-associated protein n=1 Tax=Ectothiorhodospira shaposhnikovii TaxID=1054 RepID=UPI001EE9519A|nr:hypothetical protein [Ectothiorhodospira shaposhnikovii]MCG5512339.1 hypothetical protein [Ectothiorhodospira shaposhnikovii]
MALKPLEGGLNKVQRESIEIERFIFHIIDQEAESHYNVVHLDEVVLQPKQKQFFIERMRDIAEGAQYVFKQDAVHLKEKCNQLFAEPDNFIQLSRQITTDFAGRHKGSMSAGVFIVSVARFLVSAHHWHQLVFLVKMDKQSTFSYSYREEGGRRIATIEENENSLIESKSAIQKSALIDPSSLFAWDALAFDRVSKPDLGHYYQAFLGVIPRQQDSDLTRVAHGTVRRWIKKLPKEDLPEDENMNTFAGRALDYLKAHEVFDTDSYLEAVVRGKNSEHKAKLTESLRDALAEAGVAGQQFRPMPGSLRKGETKQVYQTAEGVMITFEGDQARAGMTIQNLPNGRTRITIETLRLDVQG